MAPLSHALKLSRSPNLVQRVEQQLENHNKNHGRQKADDGFNQNINDVNERKRLHRIVEKNMGKHEDAHVAHKPTQAHAGNGRTVGHVVSTPWFEHFQKKRPDKTCKNGGTGMNAQRVVKKVNGNANHKGQEDDQRFGRAKGQQQDKQGKNNDVQVGETIPAHPDIFENKALQQQQPQKPQNIDNYNVIHLH